MILEDVDDLAEQLIAERASSASTNQEAAIADTKAFAERFKNDRVGFVVHVLDTVPETWQAEELNGLDEGRLRVSIRSGHGVGKTSFLAFVIIHFLLTHYPCKIACTAPSSSQLYDALGAETKKWINRLPPDLRSLLDYTKDRIFLLANPEEAFCSFRTARKENPEALQGIHEVNMMLIVDEAPGVEEVIFEAGRGSMSTKGAITILTGNPTRTSGYFHSTHTQWANRWHTRRVSCTDSELVDPSFIDDLREDYGEDSAVFHVRALGEFPPADLDAFIAYHLVADSIGRDIEVLPSVQVYWGLDVARFGDDNSALVKRRGPVLLEPPHEFKQQIDLMQLVGFVKNAFDETAEQDKPAAIYVDSIGLGAGVADRLRELQLPAIDVNVSEIPSTTTKYNRLRDELWGNVREWFRTRAVALPSTGCEKLLAQLTTPKLTFTSNGKTVCEPKADMKKRGLKSPDLADALCLTFAFEGAAASGASRMSDWTRPINGDDQIALRRRAS